MKKITSPVIYLLCCATPRIFSVKNLVKDLQQITDNVCVIFTPTAALWMNEEIPQLEKLTQYPVRYSYKLPGDKDSLPPADILILAPGTFNTINKWSAGISDTLVLGLLTELLGTSIATFVIPCVNKMQILHPAFNKNITLLREYGVHIAGNELSSWPENMATAEHFSTAWQEILPLIQKQFESWKGNDPNKYFQR